MADSRAYFTMQSTGGYSVLCLRCQQASYFLGQQSPENKPAHVPMCNVVEALLLRVAELEAKLHEPT